jgi:hypothetical protein
MLVVSDFAAQPSSASSIGGSVAARNQARTNQLARSVLKIGDVDTVEQLPDLGKALRFIAHPNDIEHGDVVTGERHVADRGKARRLPAIIGLRQPLQSELEIG